MPQRPAETPSAEIIAKVASVGVKPRVLDMTEAGGDCGFFDQAHPNRMRKNIPAMPTEPLYFQ